MKRMTIREILLGACAEYMNCSVECLKKYKTYELQKMVEKFVEQENQN